MIEVLYWLAACFLVIWMVGEWRAYRRRRRIQRVLDEIQRTSVVYPTWPTPDATDFDGDYEWISERGIK